MPILEENKELKVGASVMHKRYGECVVKDILNVGVVLIPKTAKGRTMILIDYGKEAPVLEYNIGNIKHLQERMTNERPMTAAEHNAQVEAERRAYHERRCRESEGYKRVYEYITGAFQRVPGAYDDAADHTAMQCGRDGRNDTQRRHRPEDGLPLQSLCRRHPRLDIRNPHRRP